MKTLIILCALSLTTAYHAIPTHLTDTPAGPDSMSTQSDTTEFAPLFIFADKYPEYPGGEREMLRFIADHIQYPELAYSHGHEGTVMVEFIVNEEGHIERVKILKGIGLGCDEAALKVFANMPRWEPAVQSGKAIAVRYITPVKFSLF